MTTFAQWVLLILIVILGVAILLTPVALIYGLIHFSLKAKRANMSLRNYIFEALNDRRRDRMCEKEFRAKIRKVSDMIRKESQTDFACTVVAHYDREGELLTITHKDSDSEPSGILVNSYTANEIFSYLREKWSFTTTSDVNTVERCI